MLEIAGLLSELQEAKPWTPQEPTRKKFIAEQEAKKATAAATARQVEAMESEGGPAVEAAPDVAEEPEA
jgi:hypothetical protein